MINGSRRATYLWTVFFDVISMDKPRIGDLLTRVVKCYQPSTQWDPLTTKWLVYLGCELGRVCWEWRGMRKKSRPWKEKSLGMALFFQVLGFWGHLPTDFCWVFMIPEMALTRPENVRGGLERTWHPVTHDVHDSFPTVLTSSTEKTRRRMARERRRAC